MTVPMGLDGAAAVLTGAGSGIGRAAAMAFAARGAQVVASDLDADRAAETASAIVDAGGVAVGLAADVTEQADLERVRDRCLAEYGRLDLVMNNVGVLAMGAPEALPLEAWQRTVDINLMSVARSNLVFLPHLVEQGHGHVVNTSSASGLQAYGFDRLPYVATKHAIVGLTEALALYLAPKGVGVTLLCPSGVITNILEQITVYGDTTATPRAPRHRLVEPDEVGESVADAVADGRFLVVTEPDIHDELRERTDDIDAYMQRMISQQTEQGEDP